MSDDRLRKSDCDLFPDMEVQPPPRATFILDALGDPIYCCPHCRELARENECDCLGAEIGCLFCPKCNGEFEIPEVPL